MSRAAEKMHLATRLLRRRQACLQSAQLHKPASPAGVGLDPAIRWAGNRRQ